MILPVRRRSTASGLMMANVRSVIRRLYTAPTQPQETTMTSMAMKQQDDQDHHKGAIEGDRPYDEQNSAQGTDALDENGLPADCDRIAGGCDWRERRRFAGLKFLQLVSW